MPRHHWRLIVTPPASGAENMALDEALMERARTADEWVLRVYSWSSPTISLGRNQTARDRYDLDRVAAIGASIVRRPTGGRAILHDREITYSVTAPAAEAGDLGESYGRINRVLIAGLDALGARGVQAAAADPSGRSAAPGMSPCFDVPAEGELTVNGRKLAGSAQWRADGALLQHGSILVEDDQSLLISLARDQRAPIPRPATLSEALGRQPSVGEMAAALADAVRALEDPDARELELDDTIRARASALVVRYLDDDWTWRR
jgi:lipoate-protein ligase A